jgi:hypothetical protein
MILIFPIRPNGTITKKKGKTMIATHATLNTQGQEVVAAFLAKHVDMQGKYVAGFYTDAETAANNAAPGESIVLEVRGAYTRNGNPATITLPRACFDLEPAE